MEWLLPLIAGLGIGSLLTSLANHYMSRKSSVADRLYNEKREAYLGLFGAIHQAAIRPSDENSKNYALWQTRCQIFGSEKVSEYAQEFVDTNNASSDVRQAVLDNLIASMRADLGK